jgi:hypothetical protein
MSKVKGQRDKILRAYSVVDHLRKEKTSLLFHLRLLEIKDAIEPMVKRIQELNKPSAEYVAFDKQRIALCEQYSLHHEDGSPKTQGGQYLLDLDRKEEFDTKIEELKTSHKEAVDAWISNQEELAKILQEEEEVECNKIPCSLIPATLELTGEESDIIRLFLEA